jgi:luciferase family oxidoreductase group 1
MSLPKLSVLDQSPIPSGSTGSRALANTIELAQLADELGYHRYWVAEHHGTLTLAGASPEVLIATIASRTERIRVGSGGVMLPHYSPLKVAETFSILSGLNPGRIDLAIGRASGTNPLTTLALQRDRTRAAPDDFPEQLGELMAYLYGFAEPHPFDKIPLPGWPELPELWLLGSSHQSGLWAGELGLPYAFADFINPEGGFVAELYRERFVPTSRLEMPRVCVAVSAICAETDEEAERLAASYQALWVQIRRGASNEVPSVEEALEFLAAEEPPKRREPPRRLLVGSPKKVVMGLRDVAAEYGADEVMVVTITHDHQARMRSYELIAEAFAGR